MGKLRRTIFSPCSISVAQVIHGSKNTIYIIRFLKFLQCLHSDLSGIKARVIKLRSPRLPTNAPSWVLTVYQMEFAIYLTRSESPIRMLENIRKKVWGSQSGEDCRWQLLHGTNLREQWSGHWIFNRQHFFRSDWAGKDGVVFRHKPGLLCSNRPRFWSWTAHGERGLFKVKCFLWMFGYFLPRSWLSRCIPKGHLSC